MKKKKKRKAEEKVSHGALTLMHLLAECELLCRQPSIIAHITADCSLQSVDNRVIRPSMKELC